MKLFTVLLVLSVLCFGACSSDSGNEEAATASSEESDLGSGYTESEDAEHAGSVGETADLPQSASEVEAERVTFRDGTRSSQIKGELEGVETDAYQVSAQAGDALRLRMVSGPENIYFAVQFEGQNVFDTGMREWRGELDATGDYMIRVYRDAEASAEGESVRYALDVAVE